MKIKVAVRKYKGLKIARFVAQAAALVLTLWGYYSLVQGMSLPKPLFYVMVITAGLFFCGWCCPFGTMQEWLRHVGKNGLGITLVIPAKIDRYLLLMRYLIPLSAGALAIAVLDSRRAFISMVGGRELEIAAYAFLGVMLFLSLFIDRPFCRYLCGFGAIYGTMSILRLFTIKRNADTCVGCGKCDTSCQMGVEVSRVHAVRDPHCINCFECIGVCPVPEALKPSVAVPNMRDARALKEKYFPTATPVTRNSNSERRNAI